MQIGHAQMAANRISDREKSRKVFWPGTETGENVSPGAVCLWEPRKERLELVWRNLR
jgi:hypothetical protein